MALRKVKGNLERMFDKNLTDLVRGIRNNKDNEAKYIAQCIEEIKQELRQDNLSVKANAVAKLNYLQMMGYDISWAGFNIIEVMSSSKFTYKRIGYLASSQCFHTDTELLMLTTNMIRKDLNSQNQYDAGLALSALSCFISPDLARDLANDIMTLLTSTKPYLRKKAVLMMYKVFLRFPEALRPAFPRLKEKLEDPDSGVQSAAVNVVCELARKNPKNYLSLAPMFFKLMTTSTNNWMLIKIIKLFGALTPLEPRLGKKLIEPLTNLIHSTSAMSLLYECINTVIAVLISISSGMPNHSASIQLCVQKLRILIEDSDQNLKYLGLLAMSKILKTHPKSVQAHKDLIMQCLDDKDESIRLRALDLLYGMVSKKNLMEIVKKLMVHMDKAEGTTYRDELLSKIIQICSQNNYQFITNFEWYVSVLVELTDMEGTQHGSLVATQMLDVAIRVQAIRSFAVSQMAILLENAHLFFRPSSKMADVLYAAAYICGEFATELKDPQDTLDAMLRGKLVQLPGHIQAIYVQNILKVFAHILYQEEERGDSEAILLLCDSVGNKLIQFVSSADLEVQERASSAVHLVRYIHKQVSKNETGMSEEISALFTGELNPVAPKAQKKVQVPEGLDLDAWINDPPPSSSSDEEDYKEDNSIFSNVVGNKFAPSAIPEPSEEELEKRRAARKVEQASNPHYLKSSHSSSKNRSSEKMNGQDDISNIPVAEIDLPIPLKIPGLTSSNHYMSPSKSYNVEIDKPSKKDKKKKKKRKKEKVSSEDDDDIQALHVVNTDIGEMPEGAQLSDPDDNDNRPEDDPHRALDINLDEPLRDEEKLPVPAHRFVDETLLPIQDEPEDQGDSQVLEGNHGKSSEKHKKRQGKDKKSKHKKDSKKKLLVEEERQRGVGSEDAKNDLTTSDELWLSLDSPSTTKEKKSEPKDSLVPATGEEKKIKKSKKKVKDSEKSSKHKDSTKSKEGYEEAAGISTPSKEILSFVDKSRSAPSAAAPPLSAYSKLAADKTLQLVHEVRTVGLENNQIIVSVVFNNISTQLVKELDFSVSDSPTIKLMKSDVDHYGVKLPFQLKANASGEALFAFQVSDVTFAQKLRCTLTFMIEGSDGISSQEKLDFWLRLPCSSFMIGRLTQRETVTDLLASGSLTARSSMTLENINVDFSQILQRVCFHAHFTLVEQVDSTASLYSHSIQQHNVCLLLKFNISTKTLVVDGKSDCSPLLSSILEEVQGLLAPSS